MLGYLIILFTILPAIELYLLIKIGSSIGASSTIMIIILTGAIGAYLARLQGFYILRNIQQSLNQGKMPSEELLDGAMVLAGGVLLLTPGFITDTLGFLLLIPLTRDLIKILLRNKLKDMINRGDTITISTFGNQRNQSRYDDIDIN